MLMLMDELNIKMTRNVGWMEIILFLTIIFYIPGKVGCLAFVNTSDICRVEVGKVAHIKWEYLVRKGKEKIEKIKVGYFTKSKDFVILADKRSGRETSKTDDYLNNKRYMDELTIEILENKVELKLQTEYTDDSVEYLVRIDYIDGDGDENDVTATTKIIVIKSPQIIGKLDAAIHRVTENIESVLPCKAEGKPPPLIQWYRKGSSDVLKFGNKSRSLRLKLKRLEGNDYTCVASNIAGNATYTVTIIVEYPATINRTVSTIRIGTALSNSKVINLYCVADGEPPPKYKWNSPPSNLETKQTSKYPLQSLSLSQFGSYYCEATNRINNINHTSKHTVEVFQIKKPGEVKINVVEIKKRSAVVSIEDPLDLGAGSLEAIVLSYNGNGIVTKKILSEAKRQIEINDLIPYTRYELNITVKNFYFESEGQRKYFKTKEDIPGSPTSLTLHALSPLEMNVTWEAPVQRNGEIIKYKLKFLKSTEKDRDSNENIKEIANNVMHEVFSGLEPYTEYNASVQASTKVGDGSWTRIVSQKTQAFAPGIPGDIVIKVAKDATKKNAIFVSWSPPLADASAPLTQYNISVQCTSMETQKSTLKIQPGPVEHKERRILVSDIFPYSDCFVKVQEGAGYPAKWGEFSQAEKIVMPESAPEKPKSLMLKDRAHDSVQLSWQRPDRINGILKKYEIKYTNVTKTYNAELEYALDNKTISYRLSYLSPGTTYTIKVIAHTKSYESNASVMKVNTSKMPVPLVIPFKADEANAGPVIGGVLTVLFILVLAALILLYVVRKKKRFDRANSSNSEVGFFQKSENGHINLVDGPITSPVMKSVFMMSDYVKDAQCTFTPKNPVPITSLKDLVQKYHDTKAKGFIDEYRSIKCDKIGSLDISSRAENKCKNRYANILAYDHSRVVLNTVEDLEGSDYVNANYIDGYNKMAKFIATQGPVVAAFNDFWRMIWEQDTNKIIMVTNLVEKSRIKCQKYWPSESDKGVLYGNFQVQLIEELPLAEYVVRRFSITRIKDDVEISSRTVTQYQFLSWPDHGVPQYPTALLQFVKLVRSLDQGSTGPIVCHCSAGVGRTGTYITLDAMLDQIENEKTVDVLGYVTHIRGQRQMMVQTEAQYIYIYDTLLEAVSCGNTEVNTADLFARIKHLDSINPGTTRTYMQEEFERVSLNIDDSNQYEAALLPCNAPKNRYPEILPYESRRVKLWPYANVEGSDYINASFVDGYQQREAYILTQSPLENTVDEFWRMLWEYEIFTIVMISSPTERSKHHCYPYWPLNSEPTLFGILAVQLLAEEEKTGFIKREFRVTNSKNGESRTISHFMYFHWPMEGSPDTASAIDMIGQVQKIQQQTGNSAIVIHCSDGSGRSGSLAALMYCLERLKVEGLVDVFQTVRSMRTQRASFVQSLEQYHFIYRAVSNFLDCFSNYANFK